MGREYQLACYVDKDIADAFSARARAMGLTVSAALRQVVVSWLREADHRDFLRQNVLFQTVALDVLLSLSPDPDARTRSHEIWRERLAEEDLRHAD